MFANPANQDSLEKITLLDMRVKKLIYPPEEISFLVNLNILALSYNQLITLHESIKRFLQEKGFQLRTQRIVEGGNSDDGIGGGGGGGGGAAANEGGGGAAK